MAASARGASLSARELEIANAYAGGASYRETAERLFIAPSTVRTHLSAIYPKLGVATKIERLNALADSGEVAPDTTGSGGPDPAPPAPLIDDADMSRVLGARKTSPGPNYEFDLPPLPVVAVLPFTNLSRAAEQAFFADGLAEDIIARLSYLRGLVVVSRTSSFACRDRPARIQDMASELGADLCIFGTR